MQVYLSFAWLSLSFTMMSYKQLSEADEMNAFFTTPRDEEYTPLTLATTPPSRTNSTTGSPDDIPPDLERLLQTDPRQGLDYQAVLERQTKFGKNEIIEKKRNRFLHFLSFCKFDLAFCYRLILVLPIA